MEPKKNPKVDLTKNSSLYFVIGLSIVLLITWRVIEWKTYKNVYDYEALIVDDDDDEDVPITEQLKTPPPPPPPPPPAPEIIEVIEDEIWFSLTDYTSFNEIRVLNEYGTQIASYEAGILPGDFSNWTDGDNSWVFVANEGNYGSSNGSISMIDQDGNISHTESIGDVVQALEVYEDKLIVLVNNSHKIIVYSITEDGLAMPGIEVSTNGSSPRDLVIVDDIVYFTNYTTTDVKSFNLFNYAIEESIPVGASPEGITLNGTSLWVANSGENTVSEISLSSLNETKHEVGSGPQNIAIHDGDIYISRTHYDDSWNAFHGSSKINF